jgi:hypothetical protein
MRERSTGPRDLLAGEGDGGRNEGAALGRAVDPEFAAEGGKSVREPDEAAAVGPGASDAVVACPDLNGAVLNPRRHPGVSGASVFGDVGQRLGDNEVGGRLDRGA